MITIGDWEVLESFALLIPEDTTVSILVDVRGTKLELVIEFDNSGKEQGVSVRADEDAERVTLTLTEWNNSLGTALTEPVVLGALQTGREVGFLMSNYRIGALNKFNLELLLRSETKPSSGDER